jgi:hypothetical protein
MGSTLIIVTFDDMEKASEGQSGYLEGRCGCGQRR